ncbi:MAG: hypothetical protein ACTXOO_02780 [Sodalis sp. (in: enterobacteria)]
MRNVFAAYLLNYPEDFRVVQLLLGYSNLSKRQIYNHVATEQLTLTHQLDNPRIWAMECK